MVTIGVRAAPMVALTACSVGVTLAMQAAHSLESLGAEMYIPDLVMLTLLREMGPVLIAVIVIGRSGSAVAAEIGTMKVSEEIEALEVMAINPVQYLVVPRFPCDDGDASGAHYFWKLHRHPRRLGSVRFGARFQHCGLYLARA